MSKFKVEYRKRLINPGRFIGMNANASRELRVPFHHKHRRTLEIYKKMSPAERKRTIKHEEIEYLLMQKKKLKYKPAHILATYYEKRPGSISKIFKQISRR